jgi:DNA-binding beta-propeller fold protein YncE
LFTGFAGAGNNELAAPFGIARNPTTGTLYITDQSNHRVMQYLSGASSGTVVAGGNGAGTNNNQLNLPVGIYLDVSSNSLFIANAGANNIVRWVIGASTWTLVAGSVSGSNGNTSMLLDYPMGIVLDSMSNVYVADRNNHRIQLFLASQSNGTTIAGVSGRSGSNSTMLFKPCAVALDAQLNLYVADTYNNRVQQFIHW